MTCNSCWSESQLFFCITICCTCKYLRTHTSYFKWPNTNFLYLHLRFSLNVPLGTFKVPCYAHFQVHTHYLGVSTRTCVHALMFKTHYFSHCLLLQHLYSPSVWTLCLSSCLFFWLANFSEASGGAAASCYKAESKCGDRCGSLITVQHTHRFWCGEVLC